ncbi:MAG TPA: lipid IV(A) 3-deoxy-D-manno-octulosonic acid transferase [Gammaproteobacteria bacterium]|nr:lipid IV(A) 3-deoxy-D-manno-octulosonic acid transferase [Gammaproteobacteria bacterium]
MSCLNTFFRWLYSLIFTFSIPALLLRLWWKGRKNPGYRQGWRERFGFFKPPAQAGGLWVHAVSVGETMAAVPIVREFQKRFPGLPITLTSTTPTGYKTAQTIFKNDVFQVYFPYDLSWCIQQFLKRVRPTILIIMEKELWLNCFWVCHQKKIPIFIANGTLSLRSLKGYQWFPRIKQQILQCITVVFAKSEIDATRFLALGLDPHHLIVAGNVKFDVSLKEGAEVAGKQYRDTFGNRPVWIAASTHAGEEELVLLAFKQILEQQPGALLILVPRHPERFSIVATLLAQQGYIFVKRSSGFLVAPETQILLGDTMGELAFFYAAADVAFVGGSLVPVGGHNALEAAALSIPVIMGLYVDNCLEITKQLAGAGALIQVSGSDALAKAVLHWFVNPVDRQQAGASAKKVVEKNRGIVKRIVDVIMPVLKI